MQREDSDPEAVAGAAYSEGYLNFLLRRYDKAVPILEKVVSGYPGFRQITKTQELVGLALLDQKQTSEARKWYPISRRAISIRRGGIISWPMHIPRGELGQCADELQAVCDNYPESELLACAKYYLGDCYCSLGDNEKAADIFGELVDQFKESSWSTLAKTRITRLQDNSGAADGGGSQSEHG